MLEYRIQALKNRIFSYIALRQFFDEKLAPLPGKYAVELVLFEDFSNKENTVLYEFNLKLRSGYRKTFRTDWAKESDLNLIPFLIERSKKPLEFVKTDNFELAERLCAGQSWPGLFGTKRLSRGELLSQLRLKNHSMSEDWLNLSVLRKTEEPLIERTEWPELKNSGLNPLWS